MISRKVRLVLSVLAVSYVCDAAKILFVSPLPGKSHGILGDGVVKHLLNAGHEVTYITPFPKNKNNPKLHEIDVSSHMDFMEEHADMMNLKAVMDKKFDSSDQVIYLFMFDHFSKLTLNHKNVQKLLNDPTQHFDLVIAEWMFNELYSGLASLYNAPFIWLSTIEPHWMILNLIDENTNPSYNGYIIADSPPFTFCQRLSELWFMIKMGTIRETVINVMQTLAYNSILAPLIEARGKVAPSFSELRYNASLVLGNSHVSMGQAIRLPQNYKPIGGYHIDDNIKPLPEDLKKLLDEAKDGVIYFSMGSNLQSKDLPDEVKKSLLEVFGSLKQTVLWKFEEKFPNLPKNVHILNWAPQQSILAHPNCVLFITHGGLLSTTETIYAGKPIIGIPVFADQFANVARAVSKGFARKVDLSYSMGEELKSAIEDILSNPRYIEKAKELSFIYHDRPVKPSTEMMHWVEHVLKTGGAAHLRSPALMVPWYQKLYLDLTIILIIVLIIIKKAIKFLLSLRRPKSTKSSKKTN